MEVNQLKQNLLDKLISIEDESLLQRVNELIENVDIEKKTFKVSDEQREMLVGSEMDIAKGNIISNEDLNDDEDKWLNG